MKIFISGICGFVGSEMALGLRGAGYAVCGCDNFSRAGSELNLPRLEAAGVEVWRGDVRFEKDLERARGIDWVIDAAANPSVLAGVDGKTSSRELLEHNLWGTVNLLEVCKRENAGMILLSTSRVYSIEALCALPVTEKNGAFVLEATGKDFGPRGIKEDFSTAAPVSLYGASKLASEQIALEYGAAFGFPVWVNRCGVMAGAGQFGKADQGIFSFWIHSWARKAPLKYIGFGGTGYQVRDCLHPGDLGDLVLKQLEDEKTKRPKDQETKSRSKAELQMERGAGSGEGGEVKRLRDEKTKRLRDEEAKGGKECEGGKVGRWEGGAEGLTDEGAKGQRGEETKRLKDQKTKGSDGHRPPLQERRIFNVSGGVASAMSLRQLSEWCAHEFGPREVAADFTPRPFDLPWVVLDSSRTEEFWDWKPRRSVQSICAEIARHAREHPEWLAISGR